MPTNRFSIYFDPDQPLLMRRWLRDQGVKYAWPLPGGELWVKVESGEDVAVHAHDLITHVTGRGRDWVEVFTSTDERPRHCAPVPKE